MFAPARPRPDDVRPVRHAGHGEGGAYGYGDRLTYALLHDGDSSMGAQIEHKELGTAWRTVHPKGRRSSVEAS